MSPRGRQPNSFRKRNVCLVRASRRRDLNVKGPQRAETAPISVARQGPLTCPLATFAVAICNGSKTSTPAVRCAQLAIIPDGGGKAQLLQFPPRSAQAGNRTPTTITSPTSAETTAAAAPICGPKRKTFSERTNSASAATQTRFMTPKTNSSAINNAQQPRQ